MSGLWERNRRYPRRLLSSPETHSPIAAAGGTEIGACRILDPRARRTAASAVDVGASCTSAGRHTTPRQATSWRRRDPCERYRLLLPGKGKAPRLQFTAAIAARLLCASTLIWNAVFVKQRAPRRPLVVSSSVPPSLLFKTSSKRISASRLCFQRGRHCEE